MDWLNDLKIYEQINVITKCIVDEFIQNIYICEDKSIKIEFKYGERYNDASSYLKLEKNMI